LGKIVPRGVQQVGGTQDIMGGKRMCNINEGCPRAAGKQNALHACRILIGGAEIGQKTDKGLHDYRGFILNQLARMYNNPINFKFVLCHSAASGKRYLRSGKYNQTNLKLPA
jgi:hypothetical protein